MSDERRQQDSEAQGNTRGDLQSSQAWERTRQNRQDGNYDLNAVRQSFPHHPNHSTGQLSAASSSSLHRNTAGGDIQPLASRPQGTGPAPHDIRPNVGRQANDNGQPQDARRVIPGTAIPHGRPRIGMGWSRSLRELPPPPGLQRPQKAAYRGHGENLTGRLGHERQQDTRRETAHQQQQPLKSGPQADPNAATTRDSVIGSAPRASTNNERGKQPRKPHAIWTRLAYEAISESPNGGLTMHEVCNVLRAKYPDLAPQSEKRLLACRMSSILRHGLNYKEPYFRRDRKVNGVWLYKIAPRPVTVQTPPHHDPSQNGQSNETIVDDSDSDASWDTVDEDSDAEETSEHVRTTGGMPETQAATRESSWVLSDQKSGAGAKALRAKKRISSPLSYFEERQEPSQRAEERQVAAAIKWQRRETELEGAKERRKTTKAEWKKRYKDNGPEARRELEELEREQESLFKLPRWPSNGEGA